MVKFLFLIVHLRTMQIVEYQDMASAPAMSAEACADIGVKLEETVKKSKGLSIAWECVKIMETKQNGKKQKK